MGILHFPHALSLSRSVLQSVTTMFAKLFGQGSHKSMMSATGLAVSGWPMHADPTSLINAVHLGSHILLILGKFVVFMSSGRQPLDLKLTRATLQVSTSLWTVTTELSRRSARKWRNAINGLRQMREIENQVSAPPTKMA